MSKRQWKIVGAASAAAYLSLKALARYTAERPEIDDDNPYLDGQVGAPRERGFYEQKVKPTLDGLISFVAMVALSPVYAAVAAVVYLDDPGPVLFTQKRIGKDGRFFLLHKFRSMKMSTPHDVPTHCLENPKQYITGVGRLLRRYSLDELPQFWDIFRGRLSLIGPRPALWNQYDLIAEREKYGANSVRPGLTGWAQINGRDELSIAEKARLDGEYVRRLSFAFDCKCFFGTFGKVLRGDGVIEGKQETAKR